MRTLSAVTCYRRKITPSICISTDKPFNFKMSIGCPKGQEEINRLLILFITELLLVPLIKTVGLINFGLGGSSPQEEGAAWLSQPYGSGPLAWVRLFWEQRVGGLRPRRPCLQHTTLGVLSPLPAADPEPPGLVPPSYFREPSAREDGSTREPEKSASQPVQGAPRAPPLGQAPVAARMRQEPGKSEPSQQSPGPVSMRGRNRISVFTTF